MRRHLALFAILVAAVSLAAQESQIKARGFKVNGVYRTHGLDTINAFNGNLTLRIPIGQVYEVADGLSYQFALHYNSNLWEAVKEPSSTYEDCCTVARPHRRANAGFGWVMSFGRLYQPSNATSHDWVYETPDGSEHRFSDTLNPGDPDDDPGFDPKDDPTTFSRDGLYLRMLKVGSGLDERRIIEYPDGTRHKFKAPPANDEPWRLEEIKNQFDANWVRIAYDETVAGRVRWEVTDSRGRTHFVDFLDHQDGAGPFLFDSELRHAAASFELGAFNGGAVRYEVTYEEMTVDRPEWHDLHSNVPKAVDIWMLKTLRASDLNPSSPALPQTYSFKYQPGEFDAGSLYEMTLPTGGRVQWVWRQYDLPVFDILQADPYQYQYSWGVTERLSFERTNSGTVPDAATTYHSDLFCDPHPNPDPVDCLRRDAITTIRDYERTSPTQTQPIYNYLDPANPAPVARSEHFFSVSVDDFGVWKDEEYGQPFTRRTTDASGRFLSQRIYSGSGTTPLRSTFLKMECVLGEYGCVQGDGNWRTSSTSTVFEDGTYIGADHSGWNGYGRYSTTTTSSSIADTPTRVETTTYEDPEAGHWVTNRYSSKAVKVGDRQTTMEFQFDGAGLLLKQRRLKDTSTAETRSATDLVSEYAYDTATGRLEAVRYFGGDTGSVEVAELDVLSLGVPTYSVAYGDDVLPSGDRHQYTQYGSGAFQSILFDDVTRDLNTGLVASRRDTTGLETVYDYDYLGRIIAEKGPVSASGKAGRAWTKYDYRVVGGAHVAVVETFPNGSLSGTALTTTTSTLDGFGREIERKNDMPGSTSDAVSRTTYSGRGLATSVVAPGAGAATRIAYDIFGRETSVTLPDNSVHGTVYTGTSSIVRSKKVWKGTSEVLVKNKEVYDGLGRLRSVIEDFGGTEPLQTYYEYDQSDNLTAVRMTRDAAAQERIFDYDGRGFLRWESHPESGMASYLYDARGNVKEKEFGAVRSTADLRFTYDEAQRLTLVEARSANHSDEYRPLKQFFYTGYDDDLDGQPDSTRGLLWSRIRYNYPVEAYGSDYLTQTVRVRESFDYGDLAGRVTKKTTRIDLLKQDGPDIWTTMRQIYQYFDYEDWDQPATTFYPVCTNCGAPPQGQVNLTSTIRQGYLEGLSEIADNITYHPNGMRHVLQRFNGMADTQVPEPDMSRPLSLSSGEYCVAPRITSVSDTYMRVASIDQAHLTVTASIAAVQYQWYLSDVPINGATSATYDPTEPGIYSVMVSNACGSQVSEYIFVETGPCEDVNALRTEQKPGPPGRVVLTANAFGTETITYKWYLGTALQHEGAEFTTPVLTESTEYRVVASNSCNPQTPTSIEELIVAEVRPSAPSNLLAIGRPNGVGLEWIPSAAGATQEIERRTAGGAWRRLEILDPSQAAYDDVAIVQNQGYAYRIVALDEHGTRSLPSNVDVAITTTFTVVGEQGTEENKIMNASHLDEILTAVNHLRAVAGWAPVDWPNILAESDELVDPLMEIRASHVMALRLRMNEVLHALGAAVGAYKDPDLRGVEHDDKHISELQERAQ